MLPRALAHAAALGAMSYGYRKLVAVVSSADAGDWMLSQRGGLFQFLTICALAVAWLTTFLAFLQSLAPGIAAIAGAKRALALVALPTSMIVTEIYWPLMLLAPSLIAQVDLSPGEDGKPPPAAFMYPLPVPLDLALHAAPLAALLVDFFGFEHRYSRKEAVQRGRIAALFTGLAYGVWVEWCASANRTFPYPFLKVPVYIRVCIYAVATAIAFLSFWAINNLHPVPHPSEGKLLDEDDDDAFGVDEWVWFHRIRL